jgi:hypothetical protein
VQRFSFFKHLVRNSTTMKTSLLTVTFAFVITIIASAQSESFMMLRDKFRGSENVFSFGTSGFIAKTVLWVAGEREYKEVFRDITNIRMIVIPRKAFHKKHVTVRGFKKAAKNTDQYEEVLTIRDGNDDVSVLLQEDKKKNKRNHYLMLVEDNSEVVAVEMSGYIDLQELRQSYENSRTKNNNYYHPYNYRYNRSYNYRYKRS